MTTAYLPAAPTLPPPTDTVPDYYLSPDLEAWLEAYPVTLPPDWAAAHERIRAALSARVAALDGLGGCAGYARMVLKAWRINAATTVAAREGQR